MATEIKIVEEARKPLAMNPKKFALWLFITTVVMLFAAWTSAYLVQRSSTGWVEVIMPWPFWLNTAIIAASSLTLFLATRAARRDNVDQLKQMMIVTSALGAAFLAGQFFAFGELVKFKEYFTGGPVSHSFIYVLTAAHGLHVLGGVVFLLVVTRAAYQFRVHSRSMDQIEMCGTYWHFLGLLWLYLFVFLQLFN